MKKCLNCWIDVLIFPDDPVRKMCYLCIASITPATRFAIEGGMEDETAYNASDLYIPKTDACRTIEEMHAVHKDIYLFHTRQQNPIKIPSFPSQSSSTWIISITTCTKR